MKCISQCGEAGTWWYYLQLSRSKKADSLAPDLSEAPVTPFVTIFFFGPSFLCRSQKTHDSCEKARIEAAFTRFLLMGVEIKYVSSMANHDC